MECDFGAIEFFCAPSYLPNRMKQSEHLLENAENCAQLAKRATDQPTRSIQTHGNGLASIGRRTGLA
jgi:hypothetical protein